MIIMMIKHNNINNEDDDDDNKNNLPLLLICHHWRWAKHDFPTLDWNIRISREREEILWLKQRFLALKYTQR